MQVCMQRICELSLLIFLIFFSSGFLEVIGTWVTDCIQQHDQWCLSTNSRSTGRFQVDHGTILQWLQVRVYHCIMRLTMTALSTVNGPVFSLELALDSEGAHYNTDLTTFVPTLQWSCILSWARARQRRCPLQHRPHNFRTNTSGGIQQRNTVDTHCTSAREGILNLSLYIILLLYPFSLSWTSCFGHKLICWSPWELMSLKLKRWGRP